MKPDEIQTIFNYNYWANQKLLTAGAKVTQQQFEAPGSFPYGGLRGTLVHVMDAEYAWRMRLSGDLATKDMAETDFPTISSLEERWKNEEKGMRGWLAGIKPEALDVTIEYTIDSGAKRKRVLWHCLYHVVNHGTQHRSEAAALLTDFGQSPGDVDFTLFLNG